MRTEPKPTVHTITTELTINQKVNCKANSLKLYSYQTLANMIRRGYPLPSRYSPEYLIPKQHLEFREPKRNPLLIN